MKNKLMESYKRLQQFMKLKNYSTKILDKETEYKYKNSKGVIVDFVLCPGTYVLDCDSETMAKIMDMNSKINTAWLKGVITLEEIDSVLKEVWEN
ncbi:MAG: hypothetical protein ACRCXQ_09350 [Vagococcus fluvialis]